MSTASATVTLANLSGSPLLWTDTGSYGTIISRTLTIYDYQGNVLTTQSLGSTLTFDFDITSDNWYQFTGVVVDNTGTYTSQVYYVSTGFYWVTYQSVYNASNCGCNNDNWNLVVSQLALASALRANLAGLAGAAQAQRDVVAANVFVNMSIVIQLV